VEGRHVLARQLDRATALVRARIARHRSVLETRSAALMALSPLGVLERGYAVVTRSDDGSVVTAAGQVGPGDGLSIRLRRGRLEADVTGTDADGID